jgi:hypothetical protein
MKSKEKNQWTRLEWSLLREGRAKDIHGSLEFSTLTKSIWIKANRRPYKRWNLNKVKSKKKVPELKFP